VSRMERRIGRIENICRDVLAAWDMRFALGCRKKTATAWKTMADARVISSSIGIVDSQLALIIHLAIYRAKCMPWRKQSATTHCSPGKKKINPECIPKIAILRIQRVSVRYFLNDLLPSGED